MHTVVVGCGRVGTRIALTLTESGHTVTIVDRRPEAFRWLGDEFTGDTIVGVGFDRDVLVEAGIERASAVAAVTNGDNSNILVARVARETFGVERVVARIYDTRRAAIYERLGIPTVATVGWTSARVLSRLTGEEGPASWVDPTAQFTIRERLVDATWAGRTLGELETALSGRAVLVTRIGLGQFAQASLVVQEGDLVHILAQEGL